ncbi:MAG: hypothetical protein WC588_02935 [Candidatus Micrarchaeia archaeon]
MMVLRCSSNARNMRELVSLSDAAGLEALFLSPAAASKMTLAELEFAFYLAKRAFEANGNVSKKRMNEAMLFLACETNFSSAARKMGAADPSDFALVLEGDSAPARLRKALELESLGSMRLLKWGKKKGDYSEGELAVERMALARIRN